MKLRMRELSRYRVEFLTTYLSYNYVKFGVDSSSRFPFRTRTHRQTHRHTDKVTYTTDRPTHVSTDSASTGVGSLITPVI